MDQLSKQSFARGHGLYNCCNVVTVYKGIWCWNWVWLSEIKLSQDSFEIPNCCWQRVGAGILPSTDKPVEPRTMRNSTDAVVCSLHYKLATNPVELVFFLSATHTAWCELISVLIVWWHWYCRVWLNAGVENAGFDVAFGKCRGWVMEHE